MKKSPPKPAARGPAPPGHLSGAAQALWNEIHAGWVLDPSQISVLAVSLQAFDRAEQARQLIDREGVTVKDRWQQTKAHPALNVERDSRAAYLAGLRQLGLDLVAPAGRIGRPPGS